MHDAGIGRKTSPDWIECSSAKVWARTELPYEPIPSFGSHERTSLQQSIVDDESEIMRLEDSTRQLRDRVGRNRARLAPIRLIPDETLSAIFLSWLQYFRKRPASVPTKHFAPPSSIMKVCRRWTACAISTPAIWTDGQYRIDASHIARHKLVGTFKTYFERSGSRNLSVQFDASDEDGHNDSIWCELIKPSLCRMEDLAISGTDENRNHQIRVMSLDISTRLTHLILSKIDFTESPGELAIVLPKVRTVEYYYCRGHLPIECPGLVQCNIEDSSLSYSYGLSLSITSPLLEKAYLCFNKMARGQFLSQPTFPSLKHLTVAHHNDPSVPNWFFGCPNICRLDFELAEESFWTVIPSLSLSIFSSLTFLTLTLFLTLGGNEIQMLHEWMAQAHNLVEFQLTLHSEVLEETGISVYIEPLLSSKRNPPCFPHLKRIIMGREPEIEAALFELLLDRATDAERVEAGYPPCDISSGIVQRPCRLTLVEPFTPPDTTSVGLTEFLEICRRRSLRTPEEEEEDVEAM